MDDGTKIIVFLLAGLFLYICFKAQQTGELYRNLYQEKMRPRFPVSNSAAIKEIQTNYLGILPYIPILPFFLVSTLFKKVSDPRLKILQRQVQLYWAMSFVIVLLILLAVFLDYGGKWGSGV